MNIEELNIALSNSLSRFGCGRGKHVNGWDCNPLQQHSSATAVSIEMAEIK